MLSLAVLGLSNVARGQDPAVLRSERIGSSGQSVTTGGSVESGGLSDSDYDTDSDPYIATTGSSVGAGTAYGASTADAENVIAFNTEDFVPQVDATATVDVSESTSGDSAGIWASATANGDFKVKANSSLPAITSGELRSQMYLVVSGGETGAMQAAYATLTAVSANSTVTASRTYGPLGWSVTGLLKNRTGTDDTLSDFYPGGGLNELFYATESTSVNDEHLVRGNISAEAGGSGSSFLGASSRGYSVTSSYSIHEIP